MYFHVWCFLLFLFSMLSLVWSSEHYCFHLFFISRVSLLALSGGFCLVSLASVVLAQIMSSEKVFSLLFCFFVGLMDNQFGSRSSASLSWSCGVRKNKELSNGTRFFN